MEYESGPGSKASPHINASSSPLSRAIFENAVDGLITINSTGTIESFNPACERIFGYKAAEVIGQNIKILMPPPYHDEHDGYLEHYNTTGKARIIGTAGREVSGRRKNGSVFPMDLSISGFELEDGQHFCGIIRDITQRRRTEKSLRDSEARLRSVISSTIDGLITIDVRGNIQIFNPACEKIFGYSATEVAGQNIRILMPEPYHSEHDGYLKHYNYTGEARIIGTAGREVSGLRKDGSVFAMDLSISRYELEDGVYFCGIIRDITKAKQAEEGRQALLLKLIESNTELERFAYVASHDMQEPIRMVVNFSEIILKEFKDKLNEEGQDFLNIIHNSAHRLQEMVHDLLQYARLGHESLSFGTVDLDEQFKNAMANLNELIKETGAQVTAIDLPVVNGSAVQLLRLLQNLIANAIKYQPTGQMAEITLKAGREGEDWLIAITDNGIGIDETYLKQVFEPFRRLHNWEHIKGTGLGLSVCRKIVENHGGRIWVDSQPGKGSTFYFTVSKPVEPDQAPPA